MVVDVENLDAIREGNCVVDFYTSTCAPCKAMHPMLEELSEEFSQVKVARVEVTQNPVVSQAFGVMSVPTVMFLQNGTVKETSRGFQPKNALKQMIQKCFDAR
jgi:thioredoxin 1